MPQNVFTGHTIEKQKMLVDVYSFGSKVSRLDGRSVELPSKLCKGKFVSTVGRRQCDQLWPFLPLWQHFKVFGFCLRIYLALHKFFYVLWQILYAIGEIFIDVNGKISKNKLAIWSHWSTHIGKCDARISKTSKNGNSRRVEKRKNKNAPKLWLIFVQANFVSFETSWIFVKIILRRKCYKIRLFSKGLGDKFDCKFWQQFGLFWNTSF